MYRSFLATSVLRGCVALLPIWAQTPPAPPTASDSTPQRVQAGLLNTVKATRAKPNDPITAQTVTPLTLKDGTAIPVGSTLLGHVVKAESDSADGHMSSIEVKFDSVELKKKAKLPLKLSLVSAMASAPVSESGQKLVAPSQGPLPNDHPLDGHSYSVTQDTPNLINDPTQGHSGISNGKASEAQRKPTAAHTGSVIGLPGVTLQIDDGPEGVTTFVSAKKNLQLDSGLQLMLVVVQ
jgi:hypothetical protein